MSKVWIIEYRFSDVESWLPNPGRAFADEADAKDAYERVFARYGPTRTQYRIAMYERTAP